MADLAESAAALVITGADLVPDDVTGLIGGSPRRRERRGEAVVFPGGGRRIAQTGRWEQRAAPARPADIDAQIAALFAGLSDDTAKWAALAARFSVVLHASLYLAGPVEAVSLAPESAAILARRHATLRLELFAAFTPAASCGG